MESFHPRSSACEVLCHPASHLNRRKCNKTQKAPFLTPLLSRFNRAMNVQLLLGVLSTKGGFKATSRETFKNASTSFQMHHVETHPTTLAQAQLQHSLKSLKCAPKLIEMTASLNRGRAQAHIPGTNTGRFYSL